METEANILINNSKSKDNITNKDDKDKDNTHITINKYESPIIYNKLQEKSNEEKILQLKKKISLPLQVIEANSTEKAVYFFCTFNQTFTKIVSYTSVEIIYLLKDFQKDNFFILQIDNDPSLYEQISKENFNADFENYVGQMNTLTVDYCFSPVDDYLYFNLSVISSIKADVLDKKLIQIIVHKAGIYINNKDGCADILQIFMKKFSFKELKKKDFFKVAEKLKGKEESKVNDFNIKNVHYKNFNEMNKKKKNKNKNKKKNKKKAKRNLSFMSDQNKPIIGMKNEKLFSSIILEKDDEIHDSPAKKSWKTQGLENKIKKNSLNKRSFSIFINKSFPNLNNDNENDIDIEHDNDNDPEHYNDLEHEIEHQLDNENDNDHDHDHELELELYSENQNENEKELNIQEDFRNSHQYLFQDKKDSYALLSNTIDKEKYEKKKTEESNKDFNSSISIENAKQKQKISYKKDKVNEFFNKDNIKSDESNEIQQNSIHDKENEYIEEIEKMEYNLIEDNKSFKTNDIVYEKGVSPKKIKKESMNKEKNENDDRSQNSNKSIYGSEYYTVTNFCTDDLIYWLLINSLEKLEIFGNELISEANNLKGLYLILQDNERTSFFKRIHTMEISTQVIFQEVVIKKKFLKYSKAQFKNFNKLSNNFYFKSSFNFFIELMINKVTQLEIVIEKLQSNIRMIKENYSITIEDNTAQQNIKLNNVMKVLAIITTIYAPFDIVASLFGMNIRVPFQDQESLWPFFGILMGLFVLFLCQLYLFKRLNWF